MSDFLKTLWPNQNICLSRKTLPGNQGTFQSINVQFKLSPNTCYKISEYYLHTINVIQI